MRSDDIVVGCRERDRLAVEFAERPVTIRAVHFRTRAESDVAVTLANKRHGVARNEGRSVERGPLGAVALVVDNETMAHSLAGGTGDTAEVASGFPVLTDEFMRNVVLDAFLGNGGVRARTVDEHGE